MAKSKKIKKFCTFCGAELIPSGKEKRGYDPDTGLELWIDYYSCPTGIKEQEAIDEIIKKEWRKYEKRDPNRNYEKRAKAYNSLSWWRKLLTTPPEFRVDLRMPPLGQRTKHDLYKRFN